MIPAYRRLDLSSSAGLSKLLLADVSLLQEISRALVQAKHSLGIIKILRMLGASPPKTQTPDAVGIRRHSTHRLELAKISVTNAV